jgi:hypothetical protein
MLIILIVLSYTWSEVNNLYQIGLTVLLKEKKAIKKNDINTIQIINCFIWVYTKFIFFSSHFVKMNLNTIQINQKKTHIKIIIINKLIRFNNTQDIPVVLKNINKKII